MKFEQKMSQFYVFFSSGEWKRSATIYSQESTINIWWNKNGKTAKILRLKEPREAKKIECQSRGPFRAIMEEKIAGKSPLISCNYAQK